MTTIAVNPSVLASRRGKFTLALLCAVAFLDFIDASIVNIALPAIREDLDIPVQDLQWVLGGYLLTYGGLMLLGGRAADLFGRRRVLVAGTALLGLSSFIGGFAGSAEVLIGARLLQGVGAAMMIPSALSILTTTFEDGKDRHTALGLWGAVAGLASAAGVLFGGLLTGGPGWRWVMFVNPIAALLVLVGIFALIENDRRDGSLENFDVRGAVLATGGMLLLVYTLVNVPTVGWGSARTIGELSGALALLAAFVVNELRHRNPIAPMSIFRINGLGFANLTQLVAFAGFLAMYFFLTLYMRDVLGYSPTQSGAAYLPLCFAVGISAGIGSQLISRVGTRPVIVGGGLIAAAGLYWLSRIPVHGTYLHDLLPGTLVVAMGVGPVFVGVATAANAGVDADKAGLAASLLNASQQLGGALGLAILTALATSRTSHLLAVHDSRAHALTDGFQRGLLVGTIFVLAATIIALRATNTRGEEHESDAERERNHSSSHELFDARTLAWENEAP
jgi:EmrB/QacA subfamily drug resistance transporter